MRNLFKALVISLTMLTLVACGNMVEVPPAYVGKVMKSSGYQQQTIPTSKFRLTPCLPSQACERLVLLEVADRSFTEQLQLFMPKDRLEMTFDLRLTLTPNPEQYNNLFAKIPAREGAIRSNDIYVTYAQQVIRSEARTILSQYTIGEIASNRESINMVLTEQLTDAIQRQTPYLVRFVGLADVSFPPIIVTAQVNAAERREMIEQENAQREVTRVVLARQLEEQELQRKIEVEKAQAEAEVNRILASSITPSYVQYHQLQVMYKLAESQNKVFVPASMLDSVAGQVGVGNQLK